MNYNEAFERFRLLGGVRSLTVGGKALMETLVLRSAYAAHMNEFYAIVRGLNDMDAGEGVGEEEAARAREEALRTRAMEECGEERRYSPEAFGAILEAAGKVTEIRLDAGADPVPAFDWLEDLYRLLGPEDTPGKEVAK